MSQNRLNLNFKLEYADERIAFVNKYIEEPQFKQSPLSTQELETIANYILWGKDRNTGLNPRQDKSLIMPSRSGDWTQDNKCDSLEAIMESPLFNETQIAPIRQAPSRITPQKFSRAEALANCPEGMRPLFEELFKEIDLVEYAIARWELKHNKRKKEIRPALLQRISEEEKQQVEEKITHWNQYYYLKQRHKLVDLRRQQYSLKDSYTNLVVRHTADLVQDESEPDWDVDIEVLPLGIWGEDKTSGLIFREIERLNPTEYNEKELKLISDLYWRKMSYAATANMTWIDFREPEHIYQLFKNFYELRESGEELSWKSNTQALMRAFNYYVAAAPLNEIQRDILDQKLHKKTNIDIAHDINKKYGKSYTPNYISTIFKQRIITKIAEAAKYHQKVVSNLFFPEEFKTCSCCGRILLRDFDNFTHKSRTKDGFSPRCKVCEKNARQGGNKR